MHILFADILKSPTGIDKINNQYWPNRQPVLAKLLTGMMKLLPRKQVGDLANTSR